MPVADTTVGGLALPLPLAGVGVPIDDPAVAGLLDFSSFMIKWAVAARMGQFQGPTDGNPVDICPDANRFPFDPDEHFVRETYPALYCWWDGKSKVEEFTTIYGKRTREIHVLYLFPQTVAPGGLKPRAGLIAAVDAAFSFIGQHNYHPAYGFNGDAPGTLLSNSIGAIWIQYMGGQQGFMAAVPGSGGTSHGQAAGAGHVQRGYPSLRGTFSVEEKVGTLGLLDPADVTTDILSRINTGDVPGDVMPFRDVYLPRPDGSEQP